MADHLDVLGHFPSTTPQVPFWAAWLGRKPASGTVEEAVEQAAREGGTMPDPAADARHVDWLRSGAGFDEKDWQTLMDAVASGMLGA
jgi:hypothetical protein